ncbi:two-component system sensor histidine kinase YesM [Neobacillus niacini]|uniref:sensor histidine kinase n=1 Tax=Neobacillus driksii TaxID=3035913 RepID=UPI002786632C|nr:sensor histidine kinase [Neobacillus niacini]MDQ0973184.1 two-component system sensor histidine kinase YesM [Neobacillus niacini]
MMAVKIKSFIRKHFFYSFKSTINSLYLPIIIFFILTTGWISSLLATVQIEENAYKNVNDTIFQTKNYLDNMLADVFQQLVSLSNDPRILSLVDKEVSEIKPESYVEIDNNLKLIYSRYNVILESVLVNHKQNGFLLYHSSYNTNPSINYEEYLSKYNGNKEGFYWRNIHEDQVFNEDNKVMSIFRLIDKNRSSKGIVLFNLRAEFFEQVLNKSLIGENGYLTLISPDGIFESKKVKKKYKLDKPTLNSIQSLKDDDGKFTYENVEGEDMIVIYDTLSSNNWKIAAVIPQNEILNKVNYIKGFTILLVVLMILSAVILTNIVGKYISDPFKKMAKQMAMINKKNLDFDFEMSGPEEMKILHTGFKELIVRINNLMDQIRLEQEEKRQLEFAIMHAQINPHFLYNTMYSIKGLCDMGLNKDASQMISALASFFRIGISKGRDIISIHDEMEHIQHYLFIQEMRYGDDFSYEIEIDKEILSYNIIKLSLQPLIENAIYHGVKQKRGQGKITIRGYQVKDIIHLEVADNGNGIEPEKLKDILLEIETLNREKKKYIGIGLQSVNERIKIHFGNQYGLTIASEPGNGTVVSIKIPKAKGEINQYA